MCGLALNARFNERRRPRTKMPIGCGGHVDVSSITAGERFAALFSIAELGNDELLGPLLTRRLDACRTHGSSPSSEVRLGCVVQTLITLADIAQSNRDATFAGVMSCKISSQRSKPLPQIDKPS